MPLAAPVHPIALVFARGAALRQLLVHLFDGFDLFGWHEHVPNGLSLYLLEGVPAEPSAGEVEADDAALQVGDHHQGGRRFQHRRREGLLALQFEMDSPGRIDVDEDHHRAVDLVVHGPVRPDPHRIPAAFPVLNLPLAHAHGIDDFSRPG